MNLQAIFNIAAICYQQGVRNAVLSPGSRCAPLTLAFARHPGMQVRTVSDERAAAFIGLGMAQVSATPTVLICTSGTAALNYAPAVAEAYFQQLPLLVLTADRPPEWIDQLDGQTIRQDNIYGRHVKRSFSFPADLHHPDAVWYAERIISEALLEAKAYPPGPVQVNVPLREPFYPAAGETITYSSQVKVIEEMASSYHLAEADADQLKKELSGYNRILVVAGQQPLQENLQQALAGFAAHTGATVVADVISNLPGIPAIRHQDIFLAGRNTPAGESLQADLLITFGLSNISKNLKLFLRAFPARAHWHLQPAGAVADPFQSLSRVIRVQPALFFATLGSGDFAAKPSFQASWQQQEDAAKDYLNSFLGQPAWNEFVAFRQVLQHLPAASHLHLANSMAVRYANITGLPESRQVSVFANRGTSGIDGCTSTAVGAALSSGELTVLCTGDVAFFYDRNALWHNYLPDNLRLVVFNNHGGGIFRLIDGPRQQPELTEFFETRQQLDAAATAREFGLRYLACHSLDDLHQGLESFWVQGPALLEIFTDSLDNAAFFEAFKKRSPVR
ncbi:MAG: 2-succinyl-5-enolpyruvyl-6-hydroxy-3-cyclohexene-1-carboxylic-acid synthase [Adhaeribacter sp.]